MIYTSCRGQSYLSPACFNIAFSRPFFRSLLCIGTSVCLPVIVCRIFMCDPFWLTISKPFFLRSFTICFGVIGMGLSSFLYLDYIILRNNTYVNDDKWKYVLFFVSPGKHEPLYNITLKCNGFPQYSYMIQLLP